MTPPPARRYDLAWRRANLAVIIVLALAGATGLGVRALGAPRDLGATPRGLPQRTAMARERINPNTASVASLRRLPGVGPVLADAIVAERQAEAGGPFTTADDLQRVYRIGLTTARNLAPFLTFDDE